MRPPPEFQSDLRLCPELAYTISIRIPTGFPRDSHGENGRWEFLISMQVTILARPTSTYILLLERKQTRR